MPTHEIEILHLAERPHFGDQLAEWHVREWGHLYSDDRWNIEIARSEFKRMTTTSVPLTLIALNMLTDELLGSVSLIADDDLPGFAHLSPWLASLYVAPEHRGMSIGSTLITAILDQARDLGHERVYLFTAGQEDFYLLRGWVPVERTVAHGHDAVVMTRSTSPVAARRARVTTWISNPHFGGSYSHLRPGATPNDRRTLGQGMPGGLWYAGEATSAEYPGTLHGAWFSGERAATELHQAHADAEVVVVGAGMAGLAAAALLTANGHHVTVLEAEAHPGGRAHTDRSLGVPLHLGAAWMHGTSGHPVATFGLRGSAETFDTTPVLVGPTTLAESELDVVLGEIDMQLEAHIESHDGDSYTAATQELEADWEPLFEDFARNHVRNPSVDAVRTAVRSLLRTEFENLYSAPPGDLSLRYRHEPYRLDGDDLLLTDPLDSFIGAVAEGLDIRTATRVTRIEHHEAAETTGSVASTEKASWNIITDDTTLHADAVIVTVGVGVLQNERIRFQPALPDRFLGALSRIGPGAVAKAFFTFDTKFWSQRSWYVAADPPNLFELWVDVSELTQIPTLCAFACASVAHVAEQMTELQLCEEADRTLAIFFTNDRAHELLT